MNQNRRNKTKTTKLGKKQVQQLLGEPGSVVDRELTSIGAGKAHALLDGRVVLVFEDGRGILYNSREDLVSLISSVEELAKLPRENPATNLIPEWEAFVSAVPELVGALARELGVPAHQLDSTEQSLDLNGALRAHLLSGRSS